MLRHKKENEAIGNYYFWMMVIVLVSLGIFFIALFADKPTNKWFIKEHGLIETLSAIGYLICIAILLARVRLKYALRYWHFLLVLLFFSLRELDFDKRFTAVGILKSRFLLNPQDGLLTKMIAYTIIFLTLYAMYKIVKDHLPGLLFRFRTKTMNSIDWSISIGVIFLVASKSLDGLGRKLRGLGIEISQELNYQASYLEESMEWAIPFLFCLSALAYFSQLNR